MDDSQEFKFSMLPLRIQLDILEKLDWTDQKIARLTCTDWFSFINFLGKFSFTISDIAIDYISPKSPTVYKWPFYSNIGSLTVQDCVKPLSIYSSRRMDMPKAAELILRYGNSEENCLKLLCYYAVWCTSLDLRSGCFTKIINSTKMNIDAALVNIKSFSFMFHHYPQIITLGETTFHFEWGTHILALGEFLKATNMPNLRTLAAFICLSLEGYNMTFTGVNQKFVQNFGTFLDKHGKRISNLKISYQGHFCAPFFQNFSKLPNVQQFTCCMSNFHEETTDLIQSALRTSFSHFTKLTSFHFDHMRYYYALPAVLDIQAQFAALVLVLSRNHRTLETITFNRCHGSLDWMHACSYPNVKCLKFDVHFDLYPNFYKNGLSNNYEFPSLRELTINNRLGTALEPNVGHDMVAWIVHIAPHLKYLTIQSHPRQTRLTLGHIRGLILGLQELKCLNLNRCRTLSEEVDNWLKFQASIKHTLNYYYSGQIFKISRPFSETVVLE